MDPPFPAGPDVSAYVPNAELEQSLAYLTAKLVEAPGWVGVCGPPGVGKTLALRLLLRRLSGAFTGVYVPSAALTPAECERWVAAQLGSPGKSLVDLARRHAKAKRPLLLAVDEAQLASAELIAALEAVCSAELQVRAVLAWFEAEGGRPSAPLARCKTRVFLDPLELSDVPKFVAAQLARVQAPPEQRALLAGETLDRIALASAGNPRAIQRLADVLLVAYAWRAARQAPRSGARSEAESAEPSEGERPLSRSFAGLAPRSAPGPRATAPRATVSAPRAWVSTARGPHKGRHTSWLWAALSGALALVAAGAFLATR